MSCQKNILIIDDDARLRDQLVRLTEEIIPDWQIIEAKNYNSAIEKIDSNQINILVSDLYLEPNEDLDQDKNYNPSGIKLAEHLRNKQPYSFIYIVSSNLKLFISKKKLIEYIDIGINDFLDRNVNPYEQFIQKFHYNLQIVNNALISDHSKLTQEKDVRNYQSYWILISDLSDQKYQDLIKECMFWSIHPRKKNVYFNGINIYDINRTYYTNLNFKVNDPYPVLFIGDSLDFSGAIKLSSQVFDLNRNHLSQLLNSFNIRMIQNDSILDIKNEMQSPQYWKWLDNYKKIKGFSHNDGNLEFYKEDPKSTIFTEKIINIENGNYNQNIEGDYIHGDKLN